MSEAEFARFIVTATCLGVVFTVTHYWVLEVWFDFIYNRFNLDYLSEDDRYQLAEARRLEREREYEEWRRSSDSSDHMDKVVKSMQGESFHKGYGL